jgi:hypothetical protein
MGDAPGESAGSHPTAQPAAVPSTSAPAVDKKRLQTVESFVSAFVKGAKTISLYKEGHEMIGQIVGRINNLLRTALNNEPNITIEVKSKNIFYEEGTLEESEELIGFAAKLHVLGIGQIVFSDKLSNEGMLRFMGMVTEKPDLKRSLVDMQKDIQKTRIDGLQIVSILSFVETDDAVEQQTPGRLTEEQITAFTQAITLPDFLYLLFRQNEPLTGKKADSLTVLFDEVMDRDISIKEFEAGMPWDLYDPRIKTHWTKLCAEIAGRTKWNRDQLYSDLSVSTEDDIAFKERVRDLDAKTAFDNTLAEVHGILANPAGDKQPKYALFAYTRLLADMGARGDLNGILREVDIWRAMAGDQKWASYLAVLRSEVQERVPTSAISKSLVARLKDVAAQSEEMQALNDFILTVGRRMVPLILEDLRSVEGREHRQTVCSLLASVCRALGAEDLFAALGDEDYFQVVLVIGILSEINLPESAEKTAPLLKNKHEKVRRAVIQAMRRFGGPASVKGLGNFIAQHPEEEEVKLAVTSLSLVNHPDVGKTLVQAYITREDYDVRVAIVTALGRFGTEETLNFLKSVDSWGWLEWLTGKNKELRAAVRASIVQVKKDLASAPTG